MCLLVSIPFHRDPYLNMNITLLVLETSKIKEKCHFRSTADLAKNVSFLLIHPFLDCFQVKVFKQPNYLHNFVQSTFNALSADKVRGGHHILCLLIFLCLLYDNDVKSTFAVQLFYLRKMLTTFLRAVGNEIHEKCIEYL